MEFKKYQHVERYGTTEVENIEVGMTYVFPKIDGTNSSVWLDNKGIVQCGSRNRQLSLEKDNAELKKRIIELEKLALENKDVKENKKLTDFVLD